MNFAPSPPDFTDMGPLPTVAARLAEHVARERRRTWEVATSDLLVHPDGTLSARGHAPVQLERSGFDGLLKHYAACFPRGRGTLSRLSPALFCAVWGELFDPTADGMPLDVKVHERGGAAWAASPVSYPGHYHVGRLLEDVAERWTGAAPMALVRYEALVSALTLTLYLDGYNVVVYAIDQYDGGGVTVAVHKDGKDLGDPCPALKSRRRGATDVAVVGASVAEGVLTKVRASKAFVRGAA